MGRTFVWLFLVANTIYLVHRGVQGCTCFDHHPQTIFCSRDFVFLGEIVSYELIDVDPQDPDNLHATWTYKVKLITRIKGISNPVGSILQIQTPGHEFVCGTSFQVGFRMILSGSNRNGKKEVLICDMNIREQDLSAQQRRYLFGTNSNTYQANCLCKEIVKDDEPVSSTNGCKIQTDRNDKECYFSKALCKRRNGLCVWINNSGC